MTSELMFVHGRAQEHKDAGQLKDDWIAALRRGLAKTGRELPIDEEDVRFPYYGDTLHDLVSEAAPDEVAEVVVRSAAEGDPAEYAFVRSVVEESYAKAKASGEVTEAEFEAIVGTDVLERGPLNWKWVHGLLRVIDRAPKLSGAGIAVATKDVYHYLTNPGVRDLIETGVRKALRPGVPTVVVGHSLGSVVAYNLLRREGEDAGWQVPRLVTVGAPLAVTAIRDALRPLRHPACVGHWFNALDPRDVVALYPLVGRRFDIDPAVENKTDVDNHTRNRHGIDGYLDDPEVARRIVEALEPRG
jgi:pimeloyl-ACP methyl ester carboxylesterase